ncbi:MAG: hypothetical protein K9K67_15770 [Bacteriovoracaceae bacterium]|nr:hypothetical protein [Bacteriovoracaceae bacterium]
MDFKTMTNEGLTHLALSELHTCQSYYQRLFYGLLELSDVTNTTPIRSWAASFNHQAKLHIRRHWLNQDFDQIDSSPIETVSLFEVKDNTRSFFKTLENIITLGLMNDETYPDTMTLTLNFLFLHAKRLHLLTTELTNLEIDLPRVILMDTISTEEVIPAYRVDSKAIFQLKEDKQAPIRSIESQRDKKYEELIQKGHLWISKKEYDLARESFMRALNFQETAEAYNLIGWSYSLECELEKAKKFCLKAIQTDPAYGAPYNDLGSYLLAEGEVNESLKWFELAKNSRNYQNREYPYINAGRAYMGKREFTKALQEFSMALTIAPFNEELHHTVQRLKETLAKSDLYVHEDEVPPSLF